MYSMMAANFMDRVLFRDGLQRRFSRRGAACQPAVQAEEQHREKHVAQNRAVEHERRVTHHEEAVQRERLALVEGQGSHEAVQQSLEIAGIEKLSGYVAAERLTEPLEEVRHE